MLEKELFAKEFFNKSFKDIPVEKVNHYYNDFKKSELDSIKQYKLLLKTRG